MFRLAWFLVGTVAGAVLGYVASGYVKGVKKEEDGDKKASPSQAEGPSPAGAP